ncbi:MAG: Eco57I restriction-modification methylase domain-containing protein [Bacteroidia bacterium]|nr:Eco57I restriction-modification methylase domain-containing protein [Bacteroidia bacterium]
MTKELIKDYLESAYKRENWIALIREVFVNGQFNAKPVEISIAKNDIAESAYELGSFETSDKRIIGIYEIKIKKNLNLERNRVGLRQLLRSVYKQVDGAFIVFDQGKKWRFSYVSEVNSRDAEGVLIKSYTEPKRFTYLFGENISSRTAIERFYKLTGNPVELTAIKEAFSVDSLTKEFYRELSDWYFWALQNVEFPNDEEKDSEVRNATSTIRLITRIMFVWFLKQKGLIPDELFDKNEIDRIIKYNDKKGSTYYKAILQNLFFATLNTEMGDSNRKFVDRQYGVQGYYRYKRFFKDVDRFLELTKNIPFLNGGLFENLDKNIGTDEAMRIDCFSNKLENETRLAIPDYLFFGDDTVDLSNVYDDKKRNKVEVHGLINILKKYNFTIEENTPLDVEVALDPELLGKVFENLLASYNPETQSTARKQTGSFYTPRDIVEYMVDESLKAFLLNVLTGVSDTYLEFGKEQTHLFGNDVKKGQLKMEETIEKSKSERLHYESLLYQLLSYSDSEHQFTEKEIAIIISALDNCKILDPACGSGAYPMGILHKMVHILHKIDPKNKLWKERQISRVKAAKEAANNIQELSIRENILMELDKTQEDIEKAFNNNELDYGRKLYLIENCIYGVDLQPIAVQIAKLRFFISLVVDQTIHEDQANLGIRPLPNLETKFVAANTLIKLEKDGNNLFTHPEIAKKKAELKRVRLDHFEAKTPGRKNSLRKKDELLRGEIAELLMNEHELQPQAAKLLANWNPYDQNASATFFDNEWMFGLISGFDVVIGNPPYVSLQRMSDTKQLKSAGYVTFENTGDLYSLFYEQGNNLLKPNGVLCYITSNKWINANYGKSTRKYFATQTNPLILIDFAKVKIFESATVFVNILLSQKAKNINELQACTIEGDKLPDIDLREYFLKKRFVLKNLDENVWKVNNVHALKINDIIEAKGTKLKEWKELSFFRGITSGLNEAFHISAEQKDEFIRTNKKNSEIIKPLLRGKDIKRWGYEFEGWYMINSHNGLKGNHGVKPINAERDYPAIYNHLKKFEKELKLRQDQGDNWTNLRDCAFLLEFDKPKIVWIEISDRANYAYDEEGMFLTNSAYFISGKSLKYILGVLNSKVADYYFFQITATIAGGRKRYTKQYVEQIPIPQITEDEQKPFINIVDYILFLKSLPDNQEARIAMGYFESILDAMVYELYFDEIVAEEGYQIIKHISKLQPLESFPTEKEKLMQLLKMYEKVYHKDHPVRNSVSYLDSIPEIKEINKVFSDPKSVIEL